MRKVHVFFVIAMIAVFIVSTVNVSPAYASSDNGKVRVFVQFAPGKGAAVEKSLHAAGGEIHYAFDDLETFSVSLPEAALDGIAHNPNVVLIEEDAPRYPISVMPSATAVDVPVQEVPYGVDMVQARDVWDANRDGVVDAGAPTAANRKLCIIDSGVFTGHEDLQGLNFNGGYPTGWNSDGLGHGTHVTGTIAAANNSLGVIGVTPGTVQLYMVRVFGDDGSWTYASTLIDAANRCASAGANIISMSLGGSKSSLTEKRGFASLYSKGILSIAAAGNDGNTAYSYPASYDSVMSVAAIDEAGAVADFSQQNDQVEIAAPGVGVLSTVPYIDETFVTVNGVSYSGGHIDYSGRGTASGALVDGGICDSTGAWSGKVVLCQRGTISFYDKVMNVQNSGGAAVLIYNNVSGSFLGTLGDGYSSNIIGVSLSMEDGQYLLANAMGQVADVTSNLYTDVSGYEYYDGTSMATPHVSAVAALVWSAKPTATNADIRAALTTTALDLGAAGRDVAYGYGLVQAKAAIDYLTGGSGGDAAMHVADLDGVSSLVNSKSWKATITVKVVDANGVAVSGAVVTGAWSGGITGTGTCTTGAAGTCAVASSNIKTTKTSVTFTVSDVAAGGFTYDAAANADPDGDSNGTAITVLKP